MLGMTQVEFSELCLGAKHKFARRIVNQDSFPFQELIDTCNTLRISLANFITLNPYEPITVNRFKYVIPESKFIPIVFKPKCLRYIYGPNGLGGYITREKFAKGMGVSLTTINRWSKPQTCSISVNEMLKICNIYKISITNFVEDKNKEIELFDFNAETDNLRPRVLQENIELKQVLELRQDEIHSLKQENEQLRIAMKNELLMTEPPIEYQSKDMEKKMRKWEANWNLLQNLTKVLDINGYTLAKSIGLTNYNASFRGGDILVRNLIDLCNKYQISTRHFFFRYNGVQPPIYDYSFYRSNNWKPVIFHPEYINDLFGKDSITNMTRAEIAEMNGVSDYSIRAWRKPSSTMRLSDLIRLCNTLEITPSCLITDNNRTELSYSMTYTEFLIEKCRLLKQRILHMKEEIRKLKEGKALPDNE